MEVSQGCNVRVLSDIDIDSVPAMYVPVTAWLNVFPRDDTLPALICGYDGVCHCGGDDYEELRKGVSVQWTFLSGVEQEKKEIRKQ